MCDKLGTEGTCSICAVPFHGEWTDISIAFPDLSNDANPCALKISDSQQLGSYCDFFFPPLLVRKWDLNVVLLPKWK